jgi:hypothetical protein
VRIPQTPYLPKRKWEKNPQKNIKMENNDIKEDINKVIKELESKGITVNSHIKNDDEVGLGDVVESALKKFGITEERFKKWFNLKECGCSKRKKWLNGLFKWKVRK